MNVLPEIMRCALVMLDREQLQRRGGRDHARNFSPAAIAWGIGSNVTIHLITLIQLKHGIELGSSEYNTKLILTMICNQSWFKLKLNSDMM